MSEPSTDSSRLSDGAVYERLARILDQDAAFQPKCTELLQLGTEYLGVDHGLVTRIDPAAGFWEAIGSSNPEDGPIPMGHRFDLDQTYCRKPFDDETTVAVDHAAEQGWDDHPGYRALEFESYLGTPYSVAGREFGTVCFLGPAVHEAPFTTTEIAFIECLAGYVGRLLEQERQAALIQDREEVIATLSRILRHNLSNDLNVIHGHAELVDTDGDDATADHIASIKTNAQDLIDLADKARKLQSIVSEDARRSRVDIHELVRTCADAVESSYPDATVSVDCPDDLTVHALPYLERAVVELLENAAKHGPPDPQVDVTVRESSHTFHVVVADDGDGIPEMERRVLENGEESTLVHGSGLGLWMVHWIVGRHDGDVDVSCSAAGTTIDLSIPYATAKLPETVDPTGVDPPG